jgi:hypothetical protein
MPAATLRLVHAHVRRTGAAEFVVRLTGCHKRCCYRRAMDTSSPARGYWGCEA